MQSLPRGKLTIKELPRTRRMEVDDTHPVKRIQENVHLNSMQMLYK